MKELKAEDLRIGNYIAWNDVYDVQVRELKENFIYADGDEVHPDDMDYTSIPLTEKWLEDFGLIKVSFSKARWFFEDGDMFIFEPENEFTFGSLFILSEDDGFSLQVYTLDDGVESSEMLCEIDTVHHLQNTYHALKSQELTIKNETDEN